jgi:hypothetical protein
MIVVSNDVLLDFNTWAWTRAGRTTENATASLRLRLNGGRGESKGSERESEDRFDKNHCVRSESEQ